MSLTYRELVSSFCPQEAVCRSRHITTSQKVTSRQQDQTKTANNLPYLPTQTLKMSLDSASKRSGTPESSSEDLQTATLARYLKETGIGLQKYYTSGPSTVTNESHQATESSGIQHSYHDAGHHTDPTSVPSQVGDLKPIPSDESEYGSSTDRLPACDSRTNSNPIEDLRTPLPAEGFGGIGTHFNYDTELEDFHRPVNDEEAKAIGDRVAHTKGECLQVIVNVRR